MKAISSSLEILETRIAPAQIFVTTLQDITNAKHSTGSLRDAILLANKTAGADTIVFQKHSGQSVTGTITLHSSLPAITDDVTITGPLINNAIALTINGHQHRVFKVNRLITEVSFSNLKITKATAENGAAFYFNDNGHFEITNCVITGNKAFSKKPVSFRYGGGIFQVSGELTITGSQITNNICKGSNATKSFLAGQAYGGGISSGGNLTIKDSLISGNIAQAGNGLKQSRNYYLASGGFATGGGIFVNGYHTYDMSIENTVISNNEAIGGTAGNGVRGASGKNGVPGANGGQGKQGSTGGGGGSSIGGGVYVYVEEFVSLTILNSTISGNSVIGMGGGSGGAGGTGGAGGDAANGHHAGAGGNGGDGGIGGSIGLARGGGIDANTGYLIIKNSTISGNTVTTGSVGTGGMGGKPGPGSYKIGGTVHRGAPGAIGAPGTTGGDYDTAGGGIFSRADLLTLSQVTISGNLAPHGGGLFVLATVSIHNSTIAQNAASVDGGGLSIISGTVIDVISTIISANTAATHNDASGTFLAKFDLIEDTSGVTISNGSTNNITGVSAQLSDLADNGGPTQTMLPGAGSPVIGQGSNPDILTTDQRGDPRVLPASGGVIDIGAVEVA